MSLGARKAPQRRWIQLVGLAATLVLGFALGRIPLGTPRTTNVVATVDATARTTLVSHTYDHTTADLLGETAVLLAALPAGSDDSSSDRRITTEAAKLLVTTRLLLDSQASSDPRLRTLLEDLELVLAQMARMRAGGERTDRELITEAMQDRELVPRIRIYAAQLAASAD